MIGVFDSGSGGLTVLNEIRARMPRADIVYFGDIKNAPYGVKSTEELAKLTAAASRGVAQTRS
jgi:glutamate racemase